MSLTLWNSRFSVTLVRQQATMFMSSSTKTIAANSLHYTFNNNSQPQHQIQNQQQRRYSTTIMKPINTALPDKGARRTSQSGNRNPGKTLPQGRNSLESSTSDSGLNVPPFNHPHCDRQAMYQQPVRKIKPLRGKPMPQDRSPKRFATLLMINVFSTSWQRHPMKWPLLCL